ncbi:MAG: family 43 glycosylhydrolase [Bacteroidia bacterium]|nr:family 43 glycosylhydrolase [Bacteroidia bacterium]
MQLRFLLPILLLLIPAALVAQFPGQRTYCNPMDIGYRYNFEQVNDSISYRSGADPVIILHKDQYYMFVTIHNGYWRSPDLVNWTFVTPSRWPMEDMCAPAALSVRDTLYLFQSTFQQRPILFSTSPETGQLEFYNRWLPQLPKDIGPWDPALFYDEDLDRWYMYWGSSNVYPIYGAELDKSRRLTYAGPYQEMLYLHPEQHGWERFGPNHTSEIKPFTEGAWMTKYKGKYYLQYGAPGTEYNVYANGVYVGDHPLGPFTYAPYNPISYKPGGFMTGAGHGNTFQDRHGNYWNTGTPWVAVNWNFERRISMFPAGFDADGQMFSNTRFGDFPHYLPQGKWDSKDALFTGWMLLSYRKPCTASSTRDTFAVSRVTDENPRSFWVAGRNRPGETLTLDLERTQEVRAVQINYTDYQSNIYYSDSSYVFTRFRLLHSPDGKTWSVLADLSGEKRDRPNAYVELAAPVRTRYIRYEHVYTAAPNLAISDFRVFGSGLGQAPAVPQGFTAKRQADPRNADLAWKPVPGAVGYNIRWGIAPDKLYQTYQRFADEGTRLELRALTAGVGYYLAIEAFNESGVSALSPVVKID